MSATTSLAATSATATSSAQVSPYHYIPTRSICIMFVALFAVSAVVHFVYAIRFRLWWMFPTILLAAGGETAGWVGRAWSSWNVTNRTAFSLQILATILAPTPLLASMFIIFSNLSAKIGQVYGRLSPGMYSRIFLTCDIVALLVQAGGGGIAAGANDAAGQKRGSDIMLIGIIFQTFALVVFMLLVAEFYYRRAVDRPAHQGRPYGAGKPPLTKNLKLMSIGLCLSTLLLFIRAVYRLFELAGGWNGPIISTQWYFNLFDGGMIVLALYSLNFFHPGPLLFAASNDSYGSPGKPPYATSESLAMVNV